MTLAVAVLVVVRARVFWADHGPHCLRLCEDFCAQVDDAEACEADDTIFDPYAAESTGEFFAVMSEVFFEEPVLLRAEYADFYALLCRFYRQDPAARDEDQTGDNV